MKKEINEPMMWIAVGCLALAVMVLVSNQQRTTVVSDNTANVCTATAEAMMAACNYLPDGETAEGPGPSNCCTFLAAAMYASCTGNNQGYTNSLARGAALGCWK